MTPGLALANKTLAMPSSSSVDVFFGQSSVRRGIVPTARGWALLLVVLGVTAVAATWPSAPVIALDAGLVVALTGAWIIVLLCRSRPGDLHAALSAPPFVPRGEFALLDAAVVGDVSAWGCSIGIDPASAKWSRGSQAEPVRGVIRTHLLAPASRHRVAVSAQRLGRIPLAALPVPTTRRGIYECRGVTLWLNDPLGMFGAQLAVFSDLTTVVHPVALAGPEVTTDPVFRRKGRPRCPRAHDQSGRRRCARCASLSAGRQALLSSLAVCGGHRAFAGARARGRADSASSSRHR